MKISSHQNRRNRGDLIQMHKQINANSKLFVTEDRRERRGGHSRYIKLRTIVKTDVKKHYFSFRNTDVWNCLPDTVVKSNNLNLQEKLR